MKDFIEFLETNEFDFSTLEKGIELSGVGKFILLSDKERIIDDSFLLVLDDDERDLISEYDFVIFKFGTFYYYSKIKLKNNEYGEKGVVPEFNRFENLGSIKDEPELDFVNLSIHTGFELLNGSGHPEQYLQRAKFLKQRAVGICEKNTLAGTLPFQSEAKKQGLKFILGITADVSYEYDEKDEHHSLFELKFFAKDKTGWENLLQINTEINVRNDGFLKYQDIEKFSKGLICIVGINSFFFQNIQKKKAKKEYQNLKKIFSDDLYFGLDFSEYLSTEVDNDVLEKQKIFFKYYSDDFNVVYSPEVYYVNEIDKKSKELLNKIDGKVNFVSYDLYMKGVNEILLKYSDLFKNDEYYDIFLNSLENTVEIVEKCNFEIETGLHKLPKFEVDEAVDFYLDLLTEGFQNKVPEGQEELYFERLEKENKIIIDAGFVDYFLILWDVIQWAKSEGILVGVGRGSVGGSLVAYLLGITEIDPVKYNLLFERFLNETRVSGERAKSADALPDIDLDFEGKERDRVKQYFRDKYGKDFICSIGTYTKMKAKSGIKDLARVKKIPFGFINQVTKMIDLQGKYKVGTMPFGEFFKSGLISKMFYDFLQKNPDLFENFYSIANQPRSASVHASAVIIVPKEDRNGNKMDIYKWLPVKKIDNLLVSEWEGKYIDKAGFLKEDILGLLQLDKFKMIKELIKKFRGKEIDLNKIPLNDKRTYDFFKKGWNSDVFQFGTSGMKNYSKIVKPDNIEDLISMNALFRPGPMESNAHIDFAKIKHGKKKAKFDYGLKEVTKNTYGLYIYQEQIMQAVHVLGGLSLTQADELRTAIKKFDKDKMKSFQIQFLNGAVKKGCPKDEAEKIWDKLNAFSKYGFNRSHAAAYSIMGYWSQWLKVNYPLEFWTTSLNFVKELKEYGELINEIHKTTEIRIMPPDVNESGKIFQMNIEKNNIYWSFSKIKNVGSVASEVIMKEREKNGKFFSLDDFLNRVPKSKVNKKVVTNLILSGVFDEVEEIENVKERLKILQDFYNFINSPLPEEFTETNKLLKDDYWWKLKQKEFIGFTYFDFPKLLEKSRLGLKFLKFFKTSDELEAITKLSKTKIVLVAGFIEKITFRKTKKGKYYANLILDQNNTEIKVTLWSEFVGETQQRKQLEFYMENKQPVAILGKISWWNEKMQIQSFDKTKIIKL